MRSNSNLNMIRVSAKNRIPGNTVVGRAARKYVNAILDTLKMVVSDHRPSIITICEKIIKFYNDRSISYRYLLLEKELDNANIDELESLFLSQRRMSNMSRIFGYNNANDSHLGL